MKYLGIFLAAALFCLSSPIPSVASGDVEAGKKAGAACLGCHGAGGISKIAGIPSIGGQRESFLAWQLVFFRSGRRANPSMTPLTSGMSDDDVNNLSAYFASLPPPAAPPVAPGEDALYTQGASIAAQHHCSACHTDTFVGKQAAARLAYQREDYLVKALSDYRSTARPSTGVAAMTEAAAGLSDSDIKALAHFLATFH